MPNRGSSTGTSTGSPRFILEGINLERSAGLPIRQQLYVQVRGLILGRVLPAETKLPSSRQLALDLDISRNTVTSAYRQLEDEGYIVCSEKSSPSVVDLPLETEPDPIKGPQESLPALSKRGEMMSRRMYNWSIPGRPSFLTGAPDVSQFPFKIWRRLLTRRLRPSGEDVFGYHHATGYPPLKEAIARHLETSRGVRCDASQVIITSGSQAAFDLLSRILLDPGDTVWMEEPGYPGAQDAFLAAGATLLPMAVDQTGWDLSLPARKRPRLIYVTPSCQSPFGTTMRMEQRLQLIEIARQKDAWIIEDDYDGGYRVSGLPTPAMQGSDPTGRTIYVGTFSKTVFPALRLGFMVVPSQLAERVTRAMFLSGHPASLIVQGAMADFITEGHFAAHLSRMRRVYRKRRELFQDRCAFYLGRWATPTKDESGLQVLWMLKKPWDDLAVVEAARKSQITAIPLSSYYAHGEGQSGLMFGYTALDESAMSQELAKIRTLFYGGR